MIETVTQTNLSEYCASSEAAADNICPTCGGEFASERGVKIHHKQAHGESIKPTVTCEWCEDEFQVKPRRLDTARFCSSECQKAHLEEHHRVTSVCDGCGEVYSVKAAEADETRFCSRDCQTTVLGEENTGPKSARWNGGPATVICEGCGEEYQFRRSKAGSSRFCSYECKGEVYAQERTGENAPNWQGGFSDIAKTLRTLTGDGSWDRVKDSQREKRCELCGSKKGAIDGRELAVHHIVPVLAGGTSEPWNLMTLCASCHQQVEAFTKKFVDLHIPNGSCSE